jgi:hypothetical protein
MKQREEKETERVRKESWHINLERRCVCVRERQREATQFREYEETQKGREKGMREKFSVCVRERERESVCVCV